MNKIFILHIYTVLLCLHDTSINNNEIKSHLLIYMYIIIFHKTTCTSYGKKVYIGYCSLGCVGYCITGRGVYCIAGDEDIITGEVGREFILIYNQGQYIYKVIILVSLI